MILHLPILQEDDEEIKFAQRGVLLADHCM
ncbi:hypothetical protein J2T61_001894 [Methanocalculus sp. AMF5]|nr:hypothetical protein [Methanocalculus sp. AMF5]